MTLLEEAIIFAAQAHSGQLRKGTNTPYILHPLEAAAIVASMTDDLEVIAAAVLHETAPDEATFLAKKAAYAYGVHFFLARRYLTDPATWLNLIAMLTYSGLRLAAFGPFSSFQRRWAWRELSGRLRGFRHGWHARAAGKSD